MDHMMKKQPNAYLSWRGKRREQRYFRNDDGKISCPYLQGAGFFPVEGSGRQEIKMEEENTNTEVSEEQRKVSAFGEIGSDVITHIQSLKDKYQTPGDDRPSPRYILALAFWVVLFVWWAASFIIQMQRASGSFLEGKMAFELMLVERIGYSTLGIAILVWWRKKCALRGRFWKWWIGAVCIGALIFLGLRNPLRDIPYLSSPKIAVLHNWETICDGSGDYSTFYKIKGRDLEGEQLMFFYINAGTYSDLPGYGINTRLLVEYLPYTEHVMSIKLQ